MILTIKIFGNEEGLEETIQKLDNLVFNKIIEDFEVGRAEE
jgi:hypothetical protein